MVSFWTVAQRAWDYNEILIGRFHAKSGMVEMNTKDKEGAVSWDSYSIICIAGNGQAKETKPASDVRVPSTPGLGNARKMNSIKSGSGRY